MFGARLIDVFGTYGDFFLAGEDQVKAKYILTKIKPGTDGNWDNILASHLRPWRDVFPVEKLTFDELIQRDLDDSRVAHELIPYLVSNKSSAAKFFPPILVVLAPKDKSNIGIANVYPEAKEEGAKIEFGDFASFEPVEWDVDNKKVTSPLGKLSFNPQRSSFVIVDGQHRAMAILALHKQLDNLS